jgi:Lipocalin-like domain
MNRRSVIRLSTVTALGLAILPSSAPAQQKSLKEQLVGTWLLVSAETTNADGSKLMPFGPNPKGILVMDANGHYVSLNVASGLPKVASNNRMTETADENKAIAQGSLASYGTYTVNEAEKMVTLHLDGSTFPNWAGTEQKRPIKSVSGDDLVYINPAPTTGAGATVLTYKRAK